MSKKYNGKKYNSKDGISIELIINKIRRELRKSNNDIKPKKKNCSRNQLSISKLKTSDWKNIALGLDILSKLTREGFDGQENMLLAGDKDVSSLQKDTYNFRFLIQDMIRRISMGARTEYEIRKKLEDIRDYKEIAQAARDGVILKQERRIEKIDGIEKEIIYDTSMTPREIHGILGEYEEKLNRMKAEKMDSYLGLGLATAGLLGSMIEKDKSNGNTTDVGMPLITLSTIAISGLKLCQGKNKKEDRKEYRELEDLEHRMTFDVIENEAVSTLDAEKSIENIGFIAQKRKRKQHELDNKRVGKDAILDAAVAIISGLFINSKITKNENGKINGKSLASALIALQSAKGITRNLVNSINNMADRKNEEEQIRELGEKVKNIIEQMEEKVYPLEGATNSFDSITIKDFEGRFYPKKDYETGKTNYSTVIKIPEFSMKRGDVVLLSGESGAGKSTFLRFLKRGDINNRKAIELDNGEKVDNLGSEYLSFRPSMELGKGTNVLQQITGKMSISELNEEERKKIVTTLRELKFNTPNLLEELASKNFEEFSTGQQRRLALSKVFYRINDGTSVIIVDEPVGNVEDSLIREQLEMIKRYAEERNVMLILTTHRLDLAEDLATKRYHINNDGVMEQIEIKRKDNKNDETIENTEERNKDEGKERREN